MVTKNDFVLIKDGEGDGSELFNGEEVVLHINSIKLSGGNNVQARERGFQSISYSDPSTAAAEDLKTHYNRRKSNVSFKGFLIPEITINGMMSEGAIGSDTVTIGSDTLKVLSPTRFFKLAISGRMFYIKDRALIYSLDTLNADSERIYGDNGMPVAVKSWSMNPVFDDENKGIEYQITFIEDKE